jgi:hypothetical protein
MAGRHARRITSALALSSAVLASCGGRVVDLPEPDAVPAPTFLALPDDLADSFQLGAMPLRDVAGLPPTEASASPGWLPDALAALPDPPAELTRLSIYADTVHFSYPDAVAGRTVPGYYREGEELHLAEPQFSDDESYSIDLIEPSVPARLLAAIESRFPQLHVTSFDLDPGLSHEFGLVWYVTVSDARGRLAVVYADLNGAIVAVDAW